MNCSFHPCVRYNRFERDRVISFVPPDGPFELMRYKVNNELNVNPSPSPPVSTHRGIMNHSTRNSDYTSSDVMETSHFAVPLQCQGNIIWEIDGSSTNNNHHSARLSVSLRHLCQNSLIMSSSVSSDSGSSSSGYLGRFGSESSGHGSVRRSSTYPVEDVIITIPLSGSNTSINTSKLIKTVSNHSVSVGTFRYDEISKV